LSTRIISSKTLLSKIPTPQPSDTKRLLSKLADEMMALTITQIGELDFVTYAELLGSIFLRRDGGARPSGAQWTSVSYAMTA
jgi:hypothetical protein